MAAAAGSIPLELVAELDELCVEREQARGAGQGLGDSYREQRIQELQAALLGHPQPASGSVVAGARLERVLGVGSSATVWRATRVDSGAECAVKVFQPSCAARGRMLRRFRQGISALRALTEAGAPASIVRFLGADGSQLAFAMTLVAGSDLNDIARRGWSLEKKMQVFSGVCDAVKFAHDRGIIHGDLRPENILYDEKLEGPVLTDFDLTEGAQLPTSSSHWWYAAPEQRQLGRERLREGDVYSLGRLLQYFLTEQPPQPGAELNVGDPNIARIIAMCTHADPGARYGDVGEIQMEVRRWRAGLGISAVRQSTQPPAPVPPQRLQALPAPDLAPPAPWGRWLAWAVLLGLLGGGGGYAWSHRAELGWGTAAALPAPVPDAGAAPAPQKKKPRAKKRQRSDKGEPSANSSDAIERLFRDHGAVFERCHAGGELPAADLQGRVVTRFKVDPDGVLSEAQLVESSVRARGVARCIVAAHNGLRLYKKPGQTMSGQSSYEIVGAPE